MSMNIHFGSQLKPVTSLVPKFGMAKDAASSPQPNDSFESIVGSLGMTNTADKILKKHVKAMNPAELQETIFPKNDLFFSEVIEGIAEVLNLEMPPLVLDEGTDPWTVADDDDDDEYDDDYGDGFVDYPLGDEGLRQQALKRLSKHPELLNEPYTLVHLFALVSADPRSVLKESPLDKKTQAQYIQACKTQAQAITLMANNIETIGAEKVLFMLQPLLGDERGMMLNVFTEPPLGEDDSEYAPMSVRDYATDYLELENVENIKDKPLFFMANQLLQGELILYDAVLGALSQEKMPKDRVKALLNFHFDDVPDFNQSFAMLPLDSVKNAMHALYRHIEDQQADDLIEMETAVNDALFDVLDEVGFAKLEELDAKLGNNKLLNEDDV